MPANAWKTFTVNSQVLAQACAGGFSVMNYVVTRTDASAVEDAASSPITVCMLFLETVARNESRVMRDATTLVEAGYAVTIVDIEKDLTRPAEEGFSRGHFKHNFLHGWYTHSRFQDC